MEWKEFETTFSVKLNQQQKEAVQSTKGPVLLLAVPGSGKTTVLVTRLGYMIYCRNILPESILTVTYTVAATKDMSERFAVRFGEDMAKRLEFRTINGICARIIQYYGRRIGKTPFELVKDEKTTTGMLIRICQDHGMGYPTESDLKNVRTLITYIKNMMLNEEELQKLEEESDIRIAGIYREYCRQMREQKLMDYDDQMLYAYNILRKDPGVLAYFQNRYPYICVDEAQDTSKIQHAIIALLAAGTGNLFMVGDEDQSIYGFRAAYPEALLSFEKKHSGAKVLLMEENFRSNAKIVEAADKFIQKNTLRHEKHMRAAREAGADIREISLKSRKAQYVYLMKAAQECTTGMAGMSGSEEHRGRADASVTETAVLYRDNECAIPLIDLLERKNIPYRMRNADLSFFTHRTVLDVQNIIRFAMDSKDTELFMQIYYRLKLFFNKKDALRYAQISQEKDMEVLDAALKYGNLEKYQEDNIRNLKRQKEYLHRTVEERTHELEQQKHLLENQTDELSRQNQMLIQQNEKITRQKAQLIRMSRKVQELTLDKISFFTNITHEFRTPITLIIGPIERALKLSYNPQVIEQLNFVERNSKYLLSLVNQLMDFRKVESGKLEIVKTRGNFLKFIDSLITPFEVFAQERNIVLKRYYRMEMPEILYDEEAMRKVVTNLLSNAIKFTPNGGTVSLYLSALFAKDSEKETLYICVKDSGSGIPEEDLNRIFNRFYQSQNQVKYPVYGQAGTGIGLYLCKRIVQMHGGEIKAFNNRHAGCSFRILLPLQRNERKDEKTIIIDHNDSSATPVQDSGSPKEKEALSILVVEDNADMRGYIRSILREQYHVLEAANGEEALHILNSNPIDFIISDLMMPVMDGIELSRKVKETFAISHIPFLMLTAKTSQEARLESYRMGVDEYLLKPFDETLLLTRIQNILENRKRYQRKFTLDMDVDVLNMEEESGDKKFLNQVMEVIKENYKNSYFEVSDFCEAVGVSKSLLNKKLQNLIGQSAGQFIRNYRLNIARELILKNRETKNMNIAEVAYEVGFNDPKYFTRCFTKHFNVTPSALLNNEE